VEMRWTFSTEGKRINRENAWCWNCLNCFLINVVEPENVHANIRIASRLTFAGRTKLFRTEELLTVVSSGTRIIIIIIIIIVVVVVIIICCTNFLNFKKLERQTLFISFHLFNIP
jgi:hypothetical protein